MRAENKQQNSYQLLDSMGRNTGIYYTASNVGEAIKTFKSDVSNYRKHTYGKIKRCYNGGVRG